MGYPCGAVATKPLVQAANESTHGRWRSFHSSHCQSGSFCLHAQGAKINICCSQVWSFNCVICVQVTLTVDEATAPAAAEIQVNNELHQLHCQLANDATNETDSDLEGSPSRSTRRTSKKATMNSQSQKLYSLAILVRISSTLAPCQQKIYHHYLKGITGNTPAR